MKEGSRGISTEHLLLLYYFNWNGNREKKWVRYAIKESRKRENGILRINICNIKDQNELKCEQGPDQFGEIDKDADGKKLYFWDLYRTYDWINDDSYSNFSDWVEEAAKNAGKLR